VARFGWYGIYVTANAGNVNTTSLAFMIKRT